MQNSVNVGKAEKVVGWGTFKLKKTRFLANKVKVGVSLLAVTVTHQGGAVVGP